MLTQLVFSLFRDQWHQKNGHCRGNNAIHCVTDWTQPVCFMYSNAKCKC